ncbi:MAG TPA: isoprenylcysteine carboxylmethyltransferase family protein [Candidatus Limnocylindrales bacterium]|nr:isoprenylcysteine carboxylmethyltransferase family protein [Candidatus Limnocylindrales bacterium]
MGSWSRIATRMRVPLGFVFAAAYFWFARPDWLSVGIGCALVATGLVTRAVASGHIQKNAELATTGPYAYTRNPLYLGSVLMAIGFVIAARNPWIAAAALAMFLAIYIPVIRAEEKYLGSAFPAYVEYASHVPRLLPRLTPYRPGDGEVSQGGFSRELYLKHREYNAALGSALMVAALILKILLVHH